MFATTHVLVSSGNISAVAIFAAGVIGALGARRRQRTDAIVPRDLRTAAHAIPMFVPDADELAALDADDHDATKRALQLLDTWSNCPRSLWRTVGMQGLRATRHEAGAVTTSQLILEGIVAHHVPSFDAWVVRDAADTAWFLSPEDEEPASSAIEMAARRAVTNAGLALLAHAWLPAEDFERLTARIEA